MEMRVLLSSILLSLLCLCLLVGSSLAAEQLYFGNVYNFSFPADSEYLYYEVVVPYDPMVPPALRTVIITYLPYEPLNVSASFTNSTNSEYEGSNKDGNFLRGIVWVDHIPMEDRTLYITVAKAADMQFNFFGLNIELPQNLVASQKELRYEAVAEIDPWQTKWFLVNFPNEEEQFMSGLRGEFCDEPQGEVSMSLVFPEAPGFNDQETINPCGCDDLIVEDRSENLITFFPDNAQQMFILPAGVSDFPVYAGLFHLGPVIPKLDAYARKHDPCPAGRRTSRARGDAPRLREDEKFSMRLTLWGQELFPSVRTRLTKPDRINDDLIANVDDTPFCDFWTSANFTAYVADYNFPAFDSACFLEKYADNFTAYNFEVLVGEEEKDKVLILRDFYNYPEKNMSETYFNIVHSNEECGSFSYYVTKVPEDGWQLETSPPKKEWTPVAIGMVVLFGFLFAVFFLSSILLISRLREYGRYRNIPN
jgi:hypothetical protein